MDSLKELDWSGIKDHYETRLETHKELIELLERRKEKEFAMLLLGISSVHGNYSASRHGLGRLILEENGSNIYNRVIQLADELVEIRDAKIIPSLVRNKSIKYLSIGVGSEASCLLNPQNCWVTNTRTMWVHCLLRHGDDYDKANDELKSYREGNTSSEMDYKIWSVAHNQVEFAMTRLSSLGIEFAKKEKIHIGNVVPYLWADAIASALFDNK